MSASTVFIDHLNLAGKTGGHSKPLLTYQILQPLVVTAQIQFRQSVRAVIGSESDYRPMADVRRLVISVEYAPTGNSEMSPSTESVGDPVHAASSRARSRRTAPPTGP